MPVRDPHSGYAFIWLVSFTLFLFLAAGGGCLVMYMILPESQSSSWLAITGVTLVCLPWLFWFVTCMYRIISRVLGFRMVVGSGGNNNDTSMSNNGSAPVPTEYPSVEVKYEGDGTENNNGRERRDNKEGNKQTPSSSNNSIASRESEIPLTSSVS
ncbi:hypothetical protein Pint_27403 [Pistacia integerrima]|uniref:Uncharacterized protein n=1 Tax=Pistacia integerrima TaxID=434235 RepID=A0ACC0YT17_9ROSI|nr:hypothetical protein Pint_27403 [Pistacia integerrima]